MSDTLRVPLEIGTNGRRPRPLGQAEDDAVDHAWEMEDRDLS